MVVVKRVWWSGEESGVVVMVKIVGGGVKNIKIAYD